jgi:prolyl 4-hydroxylase
MSTRPAFEDILERARSGDAKAQYVVAAVMARAGRAEEADRWLQSAAGLGEPEALYTLATRGMRTRVGCLVGAPMLERAASAGSVAAARLLSVLEWEGIGAPKNESAALARVVGLARSGDASAMRDVAGLLLLRDTEDADAGALLALAAPRDAVAACVFGVRAAGGRPDTDGLRAAAALEAFERGGFALAATLRAKIDPRPAGAAPAPDFAAIARKLEAVPPKLAEPRAVLAAPRAFRFSRAVPPELCAYAQAAAAPFLAPSTIEDPNGKTQRHPTRTSSTATLGPVDLDLTMLSLNLLMAAAAGVEAGQGEFLSILRYRPGEEYKPHYDWLPHGPEFERGGQRVVTALLYLNDAYEGGETRFIAAGADVKGEVGDILVFWNVDEAGRPDKTSYHAGAPVRSGEKWLASKWFREGAYIF